VGEVAAGTIVAGAVALGGGESRTPGGIAGGVARASVVPQRSGKRRIPEASTTNAGTQLGATS
jgi:hypothetical protein